MGGFNHDWDKTQLVNPENGSVYGANNRNVNSKTYATDTFADLVRNEYADYSDRFKPREQELMSLADSEVLLDQQLSRITANGNSRYKKAAANSALMNQRYGVQANSRQQNYNDTQLQAQQGLAISQAKNSSRLDASDRKLGILSGSGSTRQSALDYQG